MNFIYNGYVDEEKYNKLANNKLYFVLLLFVIAPIYYFIGDINVYKFTLYLLTIAGLYYVLLNHINISTSASTTIALLLTALIFIRDIENPHIKYITILSVFVWSLILSRFKKE